MSDLTVGFGGHPHGEPADRDVDKQCDWLQEAQARCDKATPGPWGYADTKGVGQKARLRVVGADGVQVCDCEAPKRPENALKFQRLLQEDEANAEFIAASREDLPRALALIEAQDRRIEELEDNCAAFDGHLEVYRERMRELIKQLREARAALETLTSITTSSQWHKLDPNQCIHIDAGRVFSVLVAEDFTRARQLLAATPQEQEEEE